jgi:hypothetical protein
MSDGMAMMAHSSEIHTPQIHHVGDFSQPSQRIAPENRVQEICSFNGPHASTAKDHDGSLFHVEWTVDAKGAVRVDLYGVDGITDDSFRTAWPISNHDKGPDNQDHIERDAEFPLFVPGDKPGSCKVCKPKAQNEMVLPCMNPSRPPKSDTVNHVASMPIVGECENKNTCKVDPKRSEPLRTTSDSMS